MKKKITLTALGCLLSLMAMAQPQLKADNPHMRLGEILFQTPKTVTFSFRNAGDADLVISEVHPSCGCVKADFPKQAIAPGQSAEITAEYDARMMGTFYRDLAVYTNAQDAPYFLGFEGKVVQTLTVFSSDLPVDLGEGLKLSTNIVEFDDVNKGDRPVAELQVANLSHYPYTPTLMHLPPYLTAEATPTEIPAGQSGKIRLTLDSDKLLLNGLSQASIYLSRHMGDRVCEENEIAVSAVLLPAFRDLTPEKLATAPRIVLMDGDEMLEEEVVVPPVSRKDFWKRLNLLNRDRKKQEKMLHLTNIGEEPLNVSTVQVWNHAIGVSLSNRVVPPHGTAKLKITVDSKRLQKSKVRPRVLIISDDPRKPKTVLNVVVK